MLVLKRTYKFRHFGKFLDETLKQGLRKSSVCVHRAHGHEVVASRLPRILVRIQKAGAFRPDKWLAAVDPVLDALAVPYFRCRQTPDLVEIEDRLVYRSETTPGGALSR